LINIVLDIINYILVAILIGVSATWIALIKSMLKTFHESPFLDKFEKKEHEKPKVSIILPARNEEKFIGKCLDSLIKQDYDNYEIVTINDSSNDSTGDIIKKYSEKFPKVISVDAKPKPDGWMGKNWACIEGYKKASGDLLLFTDHLLVIPKFIATFSQVSIPSVVLISRNVQAKHKIHSPISAVQSYKSQLIEDYSPIVLPNLP